MVGAGAMRFLVADTFTCSPECDAWNISYDAGNARLWYCYIPVLFVVTCGGTPSVMIFPVVPGHAVTFDC